MDFTTLTSLRPSAYEDAAGGYQAAVTMASRTKDEVENGIAATMRASLTGEAAEAALRELGELKRDFHYIQIACGLVTTALRAFAADVLPAKRKLDAAVADAVARRFTVGPDGSVGYPAGGEEVDGRLPRGGTATGTTTDPARALNRQAARFDPNPNFAHAQDCADRIAEALREATAVDQKWAPHLRRLEADDDLTVSAADMADAADDMAAVRGVASPYLRDLPDPPKNATPDANASWWHSLTSEDQSTYLALHPDRIGALDGLPSDIRDEANRTVLAEQRGRYRRELDAIPPEPTNKFRRLGPDVVAYSDEWLAWRDMYKDRKEHLESSLRGMDSIQKRFDQTGVKGMPEAYLLGFSPEGTGRAIIANGNPDTADHTAVYVPGTTANLGGIEGDISRMTRVWREANSMTTGDVSTVTWLGYDAPQNIVLNSPDSHFADDGAPDLNKFVDGLHATNTSGSGGHHTVIGHSYGTTLIGSAARQGDLNADDVVLAGSPGVQVGKATDLDVPEGHVWNEAASWDLVPPVGSWGHGGTQDVDTVRTAGPDGYASGRQTIRGITPDDELFGANQMRTDTSGHSDYWNPGSVSLKNQAAVVAGAYGKVKLK
ncbi:alpha/beta hydrolase [Streptomyces sp. NPDC093109]|uniref:alpha/beta hydrolase n=1 Tax=Streptomyces sp. NPDC093109 TaxID=3154977 RepID=UPI00344B1C28